MSAPAWRSLPAWARSVSSSFANSMSPGCDICGVPASARPTTPTFTGPSVKISVSFMPGIGEPSRWRMLAPKKGNFDSPMRFM